MGNFSWQVPTHYNIGIDACDRWADGSGRLALIEEVAGETKHYSFDQLKDYSNQMANTLQAAGVKQGDRVGILLTQSLATGIAHLATYKLGAIAVPLFALFGLDALSYRISHADIGVIITDDGGFDKLKAIRDEIPCLKTIFNVNQEQSDESSLSFWSELAKQPIEFDVVNTHADDPAIIIFTSGTTGKPKGACHAQRVLLGHLPGVATSHNNEMNSDDAVFWTPADWAWIGGLLDLLLPAWHYGRPVVASRASKFSAEDAFELMEKHQITHSFLPPTALKMLRFIEQPRLKWPCLKLRSIASGGETLGKELLHWGRENLDITINEFYGQTECNMIVSSCAAEFPPKAGSMGKAAPGHQVHIIDSDGQPVAAGIEGDIAVLRPDPVMFLYYWDDPGATAAKFKGDYSLTGDRGVMDDDSYLFFVGRDDDVITSAGYRIGPGPIEDGLLSHEAVSMAAVIGVADAERTEIVTAFIVLKEGFQESEELKKSLQDHVRTRVAAHEYPRQIYFLDELPMTTTGKIIRKELRNLILR